MKEVERERERERKFTQRGGGERERERDTHAETLRDNEKSLLFLKCKWRFRTT